MRRRAPLGRGTATRRRRPTREGRRTPPRVAAPQADPFVVSTLRHAAERSLAQGAADAAAGYLTRALDEQTDPAVRAEVLVELGLRSSGRILRVLAVVWPDPRQ
jgi:hypothetical protein